MIDLRYSLAMDRIREIPGENLVPPAFVQYFEQGAQWFILMDEESRLLSNAETASLSELRERNYKLYEEILPENYGKSFANPSFAAALPGQECGPVLCALRYEIRSVIPYVYRKEKERVLIRAELFLEIYTAFTVACRENGCPPAGAQLRSIMRQYLADYWEDETAYSIRDSLIPVETGICGPAVQNGAGERSLYLSGEFVTDNEIEVRRYIDSLPQERIDRIADTITEGYRRGFVNGGKNLASKKYASLIFHLGFERIGRALIRNLDRMGLAAVLPAEIPSLFHTFRQGEAGYSGANPNPKYYYDHREDLALFLDEGLQARRIEGLSNAYRKLRNRTALYAGPLVMETFGNIPFSPSPNPSAARCSPVQKKMYAEYERKADRLYGEAVAARDRSFTVIGFPLPAVSDSVEKFREIFDAVVRINTLDSALYEEIQSRMTDVLNRACCVEVTGMGENRTRLRVRLREPADPSRESNFENCTADVNIPVGEVFTTPVLEGTGGVLHVSGVYLDGLFFKDLEITFREGRVSDYRCGNFGSDEDGKRYIEENILHHHKDLPMGECAIGTNTEAYAASRRFGILDRLPVLIAEKTGPHFAIGDTCYSREEENRTFNPDGKEIIAKDNSVSLLRKTDPDKAYFGCHTDITIPYDELGQFTAVTADNVRIPILENGRFVLPGTEILNLPLKEQGLDAKECPALSVAQEKCFR